MSKPTSFYIYFWKWGAIMYNRLRELREDKDLTQVQVAKYLDMSQTGYSQYEIGKNDIPTRVLN